MESNRSEYSLYNGVIEYTGDNFDIYSATSYIDFENNVEDASLAGVGAPNRFDIPFASTSFNQEIRISNTDGSFFDWQAGFFYLDSETDAAFILQTDIGGGTLFPFDILDDRSTSEQIAVFGETYFNFDNGLTATLGLRWAEDDRTREDFLASSIAALTAFNVDAKRETTFDGFSPRFNLNYEYAEDKSVYVNIAQGTRSGLLQGSTGITGILSGVGVVGEEEEVSSYEAGTKFVSSDGARISQTWVRYAFVSMSNLR